MRQPTFALDTAIGWYLDDAKIETTTRQTYSSHLGAFLAWLPAPRRILASLTPDTVEEWINAAGGARNTRMNRAIAPKALARYLANEKIYFDGSARAPLSVLRDLKQERPTPHGMPAYSDADVRIIARAAADGRYPVRHRAVIALELHGFRAKEARSILLRNVVLGQHGELGHFILDDESQTKKNTGGVRIVPMEPLARDAIADYIRNERPKYRGSDRDEPLFLTRSGRGFTQNGWNSQGQRIRRRAAAAGVKDFKQHRLRPTRTRMLHDADVPDSAIMEMLGWKSPAMLRRYLGKISVARLKRYPMTLQSVFGRAI